jgi:hypothetical protein
MFTGIGTMVGADLRRLWPCAGALGIAFVVACETVPPPTCFLTSGTVCGYSSASIASSVTWARSDGAVLLLTWVPREQSANICTPGSDGCYAYSLSGSATFNDVFEVSSGTTMFFYGTHPGTYFATPASQPCPLTDLTLDCEADSAGCDLAGTYVHTSSM